MKTCGLVSERFIHLNISYCLRTTKMIILGPLFGPQFLNYWDHNPPNQSQPSFSSYKHCVNILLISFHLFKSNYPETIRLRTTMTRYQYTTKRKEKFCGRIKTSCWHDKCYVLLILWFMIQNPWREGLCLIFIWWRHTSNLSISLIEVWSWHVS